MSWAIENKIRVGFGLALAFLIASGAGAWWSVSRNLETVLRVEHTHEVLNRLEQTFNVLLDLEAASRTYFITGNEAHLEVYQPGIRSVGQLVRELRKLTADNPAQQDRINALEPAVSQQIKQMDQYIAFRKERGETAAFDAMRAMKGRLTVNETRKLIAGMQDEERLLLQHRTAAAREANQTTISMILLGSLVAVGLVMWSALLVRRDFWKRVAAEQVVRAQGAEARTTLTSIGDGVITTDASGLVTRLNPVAEQITGWTTTDAQGKPVAEIFRIINEHTRQTVVCPVARVLREGTIVGLANHTLLIRKDGSEIPIADSGAPIHDDRGVTRGVVLVFRDQKAERAAEVALRKSADEIKDLYNKAPCGYHSLDHEGVYVNINDTELAWLGYPREEIVGKMKFADLHTPESQEIFRSAFVRLKEQGFVNDIEYTLRRKDGSEMPVLLNSTVIRDASGNYIASRSTMFDLTEHKRAEEERDRFFTLSLDMLCIAKDDGYFKRVSPAFTHTLGWSVEELLARPFFDIIHPDDRAKTHAAIQTLGAGEVLTQFENRHLCKDGSWRVLSWKAAPQPGGLIYATARDVTEQKRAEEKQQQLLAILDATPDYVAISRLDGKRIYLNPAGRRTIGLSATEDVTLSRIPDFYAPESARVILDEGIPAAARDGVWFGETHLRTRDGRDIPVSQILLAHRNSHGVVDHVSTVARDISQQKNIEAALINAKLAAEEATHAKSQFLANMSHELRTPLNAIIGFSEILEDGTFGSLNPKQGRYVSNVLTSGRHLLQLINDILDLAKVESGKLDLQPEDFAPEQVVENVLAICRALANKKSIVLATEFAPDLPLLHADESKFKQVLYNLLSNAVKFTTEGGRVTVAASVQPSAGNGTGGNAELIPDSSPRAGSCLRVSVSDTGIGIRPADHARVWKEFEQVDSTYGRTQQGTGLGLALTKKLVELHGGRIWLESDGIAGKGSTFIFELPLAVAGETDAAIQRRQLTLEVEPARSVPARPLVLVVEDDESALSLLSNYLHGGGYDVAHARTATQAVELAREMKPFAITLDILLPDRPGWEVLNELKSQPETRDIPVVIVSVTDDLQLGFSLGAVEFLVKPVKRDHLLAVIAKAGKTGGKPVQAVLIVDDEPQAVEAVADVIHAEGYTVLEAQSGAHGLAVATEKLPDLIILDLLMPGMNGFEVVERLRANPRTADVPILIYTSKDLTADERTQLNRHVQGISAKSGGERLLANLARLAVSRRAAGNGNGHLQRR